MDVVEVGSKYIQLSSPVPSFYISQEQHPDPAACSKGDLSEIKAFWVH